MKTTLPAFGAGVRDTTWKTRRLGRHLLLSQADIERLDALRPRCAKCGRLVETLAWRIDPDRICEIVFTVGCHGETEETRLSFDDLPVVMADGVQGAEAFREPKRLAHKDADASQ